MNWQTLADLLLKDSTPFKHKLGRGIAGLIAAGIATEVATTAYEKIFKLAARQSHLM